MVATQSAIAVGFSVQVNEL